MYEGPSDSAILPSTVLPRCASKWLGTTSGREFQSMSATNGEGSIRLQRARACFAACRDASFASFLPSPLSPRRREFVRLVFFTFQDLLLLSIRWRRVHRPIHTSTRSCALISRLSIASPWERNQNHATVAPVGPTGCCIGCVPLG